MAERQGIFLARRHRGIFDAWEFIGMFEGFKGGGPVMSLHVDLALHKHEDGVVADFEILGKGLLQVVLGRLHIPALTVDKGGEHVRLYQRRVLLQEVVQLS